MILRPPSRHGAVVIVFARRRAFVTDKDKPVSPEEPDSDWIIFQLRKIAERSAAGNKKEDMQIALRALELLARERGLFARPSIRPRRLSDLPVEELRAALARLEPR